MSDPRVVDQEAHRPFPHLPRDAPPHGGVPHIAHHRAHQVTEPVEACGVQGIPYDAYRAKAPAA